MEILMEYDDLGRMTTKTYVDELSNNRVIEFKYYDNLTQVKDIVASIVPSAGDGKIHKPTIVSKERYGKNGTLLEYQNTTNETTISGSFAYRDGDVIEERDEYDKVVKRSQIIAEALTVNSSKKFSSKVEFTRILPLPGPDGSADDYIPYPNLIVTEKTSDESSQGYTMRETEYYINVPNDEPIPFYFDGDTILAFSSLDPAEYVRRGHIINMIRLVTSRFLKPFDNGTIQDLQEDLFVYEEDTMDMTERITIRRKFTDPQESHYMTVFYEHSTEEMENGEVHKRTVIYRDEAPDDKFIKVTEETSDGKLLYGYTKAVDDHVPITHCQFEYDELGRETFCFEGDHHDANVSATITTYIGDTDQRDISIGLFNYITHDYAVNGDLVSIKTNVYDEETAEKYLLPLLAKLGRVRDIGGRELLSVVSEIKTRYFSGKRMAELLSAMNLEVSGKYEEG